VGIPLRRKDFSITFAAIFYKKNWAFSENSFGSNCCQIFAFVEGF
jgi:hypothetical protein